MVPDGLLQTLDSLWRHSALFIGQNSRLQQDGTVIKSALTVSKACLPQICSKLKYDEAFLLNNGAAYHIANGVALLEYIIESLFFPNIKKHPYISYCGRRSFRQISSLLTSALGVALTLASQVLRSTAMISAASNFSHSVAYKKLEQHKLVTGGIYRYEPFTSQDNGSSSLVPSRWFRHPSYTGFFYWGLGSQMVLQNPVSFIVYAVVIWRFFAARIPGKLLSIILSGHLFEAFQS
jgi:protein-S-isoprenylcysteine O-methyltransferase Ste14